MKFTRESATRHLFATLLLSITSLVGCASFTSTPSLFPNPVDVTIHDLPQPLQDEIQRQFPDGQHQKIQYSAETHQYGITIPSGAIFLYDASGRKMGTIL